MKYAEEMQLDSQIFAGDMDGSESNFSEKIVKARKPHTCCVCEKEIPCDGHLVARIFHHVGKADHVHVLGCNNCSRH